MKELNTVEVEQVAGGALITGLVGGLLGGVNSVLGLISPQVAAGLQNTEIALGNGLNSLLNTQTLP